MAALGDRVTYRGNRGIVVAAAPFLGERCWMVRWRGSGAATGWSRDAVPESALSGVSSRTWSIGDTVLVGWSPFVESGTVTSVDVVDGRTLYTVTFAAEIRYFPDEFPTYAVNMGESWAQVGPEHIDTHDRDD